MSNKLHIAVGKKIVLLRNTYCDNLIHGTAVRSQAPEEAVRIRGVLLEEK
jgi:hypothetical protein